MRPSSKNYMLAVIMAGGGTVLIAAVAFVAPRFESSSPAWQVIAAVASVALIIGGMIRLAPSHPPHAEPAATPSKAVASAAPVATGTGTAPKPALSFADVAGLDDVIGDLQELVSYMGDREKYLALDAKLPRGVLLYGPPGTGKTLLARVLAAEAEAHFHYASGASFVEKYVGVGAQRVRDLFARAREQSPSVIFIDEIDSIGRARSGGSDSPEWDTALNQLLTELDGFETTDNVLLVCATNRKELLDEALLRPGRLDRQIYIGLPDVNARLAILRTHTRKKPLADDVDLLALARRTPGMSGAHLAATCNEAALMAAREGRSALTPADFEAAVDRVLAGQSGRPTILSAEERRLVAYHEAGHALVGWVAGEGAIEKITLLRGSQALGYVLQVPEERALQSRADLRARIAVLLGGRAAEEHVTGDFTTGAADDLRKATAIAEKMVTEFGMSDRLPHQVLREQSLVFSRTVSAEVSKLIAGGWEEAVRIVEEHCTELALLAETLLERETLTREQVEFLLAPLTRRSA